MSLNYKAMSKTVASLIAVVISVYASGAWADKIHDPTLPKVNLTPAENGTEANEKTELELQGVVNKRGIKMAFISGELVKVGDQVQDFKVSKINNNNVVLLKSGSQKRLYVYEK